MRLPDRLDGGIYVDPHELSRYRLLDQGRVDGARSNLRGMLKDQPIAILFRQVATPNYETAWFARKARHYGFRPVIIEHRADRFSVHNSYKRSLVTPRVVMGRSRHGHAIVRQQKLVEHNSAEGRPLETIVTASGENLVAYHHRKLHALMGPQAPVVIDLSEIMSTAMCGPSVYYVDVFKLTTGRAVLFEDFVVDEATNSFFMRIVKPAYDLALSSTGGRPKIVKLTHGRRAESPLWNSYPAAMIDAVPRSRRSKHAPAYVR